MSAGTEIDEKYKIKLEIYNSTLKKVLKDDYKMFINISEIEPPRYLLIKNLQILLDNKTSEGNRFSSAKCLYIICWV